MSNVLSLTRRTENDHDLSGASKSLDAECKNCTPITPMDCVSRCKIYRLKNELRMLSVTMNNPNYINELFNVLKNGTRLNILQTITRGRYSVNKLQQELKKTGHRHSRENISKEYLRPLIAVGLVTELEASIMQPHSAVA